MAVRSAAVAGPIQGSAIRNACRMAERLDRVIEILRAKGTLWMTTFFGLEVPERTSRGARKTWPALQVSAQLHQRGGGGEQKGTVFWDVKNL
jgi:hypothetical protein